MEKYTLFSYSKHVYVYLRLYLKYQYMATCIVCGRFDNLSLNEAMANGWTFTKCPECQRGTPLDIMAVYLAKSVPEEYLQGFCTDHWFKDSGICDYCKIKRGGGGGGS